MEKTIQTKQSSENNITQDGSTVNKRNKDRDDSRESLHTKTSSQKEHNITVSSIEHLHQTADHSIETMLDSEEKIIDIDTKERCDQIKEDDSSNTTITSCRADCNPIEHGRPIHRIRVAKHPTRIDSGATASFGPDVIPENEADKAEVFGFAGTSGESMTTGGEGRLGLQCQGVNLDKLRGYQLDIDQNLVSMGDMIINGYKFFLESPTSLICLLNTGWSRSTTIPFFR